MNETVNWIDYYICFDLPIGKIYNFVSIVKKMNTFQTKLWNEFLKVENLNNLTKYINKAAC